MFTADPGRCGLGLLGQRMRPARAHAGGSSGINYMAWVRGHPGDYDHWAELGAEGWSYAEVLPLFRKLEDFTPTNAITVDGDAHGRGGPVGVTVRSRRCRRPRGSSRRRPRPASPRGDYNGRDRGGPAVASRSRTPTPARGAAPAPTSPISRARPRRGRTFPLLTHAQARRIVLEDRNGKLTATGIEYADAAGKIHTVRARREVILSAGAVGSPHLLMLSGIGPRRELESVEIACRLDSAGGGQTPEGPSAGSGCSSRPRAWGWSNDEITGFFSQRDATPCGLAGAVCSADPALRRRPGTGDLAELKAEARTAAWANGRETGTGAHRVVALCWTRWAFFSTGLWRPAQPRRPDRDLCTGLQSRAARITCCASTTATFFPDREDDPGPGGPART